MPALARRVRSALRASEHGSPAADLGRESKNAFVPSLDSNSSARIQLARALRSLRGNEGVTLRAVAEKIGYSPSSLSAAETGSSIPRWSLVEKLVRQLNGDIAVFKRLHEAALYESGASHLVPLSAGGEHVIQNNMLATDSRSHAMIAGGQRASMLSAYIEDQVPHTVLSAFASAWSAKRDSRFDTVLVLTRWVVEAVCADRGLGDVTAGRGIRRLKESQHIDERLAGWGTDVVHMANSVAHGARPVVNYEDAESALAFAAALLAQVYLINEQLGEFASWPRHG